MKRTDLAGIVSDRHRRVIGAVVEEIAVKADENSLALQLMPPTNIPADIIEHEIVSASGGKTGERVYGAPGKSISGPSSTSKVFKPGLYQESIAFKEQDLLRLRKLGTIGERGATGMTGGELDWVERAARKLKLRLQNRLCQLAWDALFQGTYTFQGTVFNFGIPSANQLTAATSWSAANVGNPFADLQLLMGQSPVLRKYRNMIKCFIINPKTEADIILRAMELKIITNNNIKSTDINEVRKFAAPGLPPFEVVSDVISDEVENADGSISVGTATFMVPDNKVLVVMDFNRGGVLFPEYGQLQLTENMNDPSASPERPAVGVYTFMDEEGLTKRKAPFMEIVSGFNGGANLMRPNDTIIISC
jgi:hypothetical protein